MTMITMTRPAYHPMPVVSPLLKAGAGMRSLRLQPITRQPVIIENAAIVGHTGATSTVGASAVELAAQGARNCWDPRTWGTQITPVVPMFIGMPQPSEA